MKEFVVFRVRSEYYAVPILKANNIIKYIEPNNIVNSSGFIKGVINQRGAIIPVIDLREKLGFMNCSVDDETMIIIVKDEESTLVGVIIDQVTSVSKIDENNIQGTDKIGIDSSTSPIEGVAKHEGKLISILNMDRILQDVLKEKKELN